MSASTAPCTSSGLKSSSAAIATRPAQLVGVTLLQASAACTLIVYDNASAASGTVLCQINNNTNTSTVFIPINVPIQALNGLYAAITGTGANYILHYSLM